MGKINITTWVSAEQPTKLVVMKVESSQSWNLVIIAAFFQYFLHEYYPLPSTIILYHSSGQVEFIQFSSVTQSCQLCNLMDCSTQDSLSIPNSQSLLKFMSIKSMMPSNHLILCHLLFLLPSIFPSIRIFSKESVLLIQWLRYWSFSFSITPSNEYSFRIDWFDLLAIQGTLKSLLQHLSSKGSIIQHSAFFMANLHIHT